MDQAEFERLVCAANRSLWLTAYGFLGDRHLADDAVQEAVMIAWTKRDRFEAGTSFTAWTAQIVRHVASNMRRRKIKHRQDTSPFTDQVPARPTPPRPQLAQPRELPNADEAGFDDSVLAALSALEPVARACLLLRTVRDHTYDEIARLLDIPASTAMSHVHRSRQRMRRHLADHHDTSAARPRPQTA
ncbi:MAG: RNA polymerase sigma factor [Planctomycetota bacterium]